MIQYRDLFKCISFILFVALFIAFLVPGCGGSSDDSDETDPILSGLIIIDHTAVDMFDAGIPQFYIDEVKKMNFHLGGDSHGRQFANGLWLLSQADSNYAFQLTENLNSIPPGGSLREYRTGGSDNNYWRDASGRSTLESNIVSAKGVGLPINISLFGWSYQICNDGYDGVYREADIQEYIDSIGLLNSDPDINDTIFIYHTSIMDGGDGWSGGGCFPERHRYNGLIKQAASDNGGILFDQADIESWNNDNTEFVNDDPDTSLHYRRHSDYPQDAGGFYGVDHTNDLLRLRKAKAFWVMMARLAGWDGVP